MTHHLKQSPVARKVVTAILLALLAVAALAIPVTAQSNPPASPTAVTVTRSDGTVTASWNDVSGATKYHIAYSTDSGGSWHAPVDNHTSWPNSSITFSGSNSKTYVVAVRAGNSQGWSGWVNSQASNPYTPQVPGSVSSVTVTRTDGNLTVSWPSINDATKYHVTYTGNGGQSWSLAASEHTGSTLDIGGVDNTKTYIVGVRAGNSAGWSGWVNSAPAGPYQAPSTPTPTPTEPPVSPTLVTVSRGNGTMTVTWPAVDGASGYTVRASTVRNSEWHIKSENQSGTSLTVTDLDNNYAYHASVRAENSAGASEYRVSAAAAPYSTRKGDRPESVTLTRSHKKLTATWQTGWYATHYHVTYSSDGGASWSLAASNHPAGKGWTTIEIPDVDNAKSYMVGVRGGNTHGWSGWLNSNTIGPLHIRLAVSNIAATAATITLENYEGNWYYKSDTGPHTTCSAAQSTAAVNLTGLTSGTTYTYKAYSNSTCSTLLATSVAFTSGSVVSVGNLTKNGGLYSYQVGRVHEQFMKAMVRHSTTFTTGAHASGYTLNQVTVLMGASHGSPTGLTAQIYTSDSAGLPGTVVKSLGAKTPTSNGEVTWNCSGSGCGLDASTTYHLVLSGAAPASGDHHYVWLNAQDYSEDNQPTNAGWTIGNKAHRQDDDDAWGGGGHLPGKLQVTAAPK